MRSILKCLTVAIVLASGINANAQNGDEQLPLGMAVDHLNLVLSASNPDDVHRFYGEILGLKRIPDLNFPGDDYMIRYMGGATEIKFIITGDDLPKHDGGTQKARGIRLMALLLPESERESMFERLQKAGIRKPAFRSGESTNPPYAYEYGMLYDFDGNQVEIVFMDERTPAHKFDQLQIGLTVSQMESMDVFLTNIIGLRPENVMGEIHRYKVGKSLIKFWKADGDIPAWVGGPFDMMGMCLVQFIVRDVDAVREAVIARGGKIHTEPFALGQMATIMFVEGPDGILFEFAGPLAQRFRE